VGGRRGSREGEDSGAEGFRGSGLRVGWNRGKNEVVGVGELPGVVGERADEVAVDASGVFLGVEIDDGEPELAVGGAGVRAAGAGDVEVRDRTAFGVEEGAGGWVRGVEMPRPGQGGWRAERDLKVAPADGHEDGLDDEEGDGKDNLGDENGDAPGAAAGAGSPGGGGRGRFVAPEEAAEGEGVGQGEEDAAKQQVDGEELHRDVEAEVVEDDVGHDEGGEEGSGERRAALEQEDAAEEFG
jgi:hypothetical protein